MQNQIPIYIFSVAKSSNLRFSKMPGGSFSGMDSNIYDLDQTEVISFECPNNNTLKLKIKAVNGNIRTAYIRAINEDGVEELNSVMQEIKQFVGKSYSSFIYHQFNRYGAK